MAVLGIDIKQMDQLQNAMKEFQEDAEKIITNVIHNEGSLMIQEGILKLMPESGKIWSGKKRAAKFGKSLKDEKENLGVTVKTTKNYQYLYFPDDGTNTRRHMGDKQFFRKGAEAQIDEIINLCTERLMNEF